MQTFCFSQAARSVQTDADAEFADTAQRRSRTVRNGHTSPPNRGTLRIPIKKPRQEQLDPIHELYNSGAPYNLRTDWNCNVCSTESGHDQCPVSAWQQQVTFPRVTFSVFSPASASLSKTWAPLDGAAVEKQRWIFRSWTSATTFTGRLRPPSIGNSKRKSSFDLFSATRAAKLYEHRIDDQGH